LPQAADRPELQKQFQIDRTICDGEAAKAVGPSAPMIRERVYDDVFKGCMASRGYLPKG
jgi:hypothetical protein